MRVAYITSTNLLDSAIGTIQLIGSRAELHVFIEITVHSQNATLIHTDSIRGLNYLDTPENVLGKEQWQKLSPYFNKAKTVSFLVHQHKSSFSASSLITEFRFGLHLRKLKADIIHMDNISPRSLPLIPFVNSKNLVITLHDPKPHSGEESDARKEYFINSFFLKKAKSFVFYSAFSAAIFKERIPQLKKPLFNILIQPCSYLQTFSPNEKQTNYLLFFGRLSRYKGIDMLLEALPEVLRKYPDQQIIIAGNPSYDYNINKNEIESKYPNIKILNGYLKIKELSELILGSKFVICPYRDATQSGVLTAAMALGKMSVATNVGSFTEYVNDGVNGILCEPTAYGIANGILRALEDHAYVTIQKNLRSKYEDADLNNMTSTIFKAYSISRVNDDRP